MSLLAAQGQIKRQASAKRWQWLASTPLRNLFML